MSELTSIANKVANIAFAGKVLQQRTGVYKKRASRMKKLLLEAHNKGDKIEAYAYAMGLLMIKNHIKVLVNTAKKILYFVDFTIAQLSDVKPPQNLVDLLTKFDESVRRGGVLAYRVHLTQFEKTFDLSSFGGDDDSKSYPQFRETKLTRKKALAELKAVTKNSQKAKKEEQVLRQSIAPTHQQSQAQVLL